jgi:hypothetical protein
MKTVQINLKISQKLYAEAKDYAERFGFRNIQELAANSMREKVLEENDLTQKEIQLIEKLVEKSIKEGNLVSETELRRLLKA